MQPSYAMGELVQNLWNRYGEEAHPAGWRLILHHPQHGLLITEDIDWFLVRRVAFLPNVDPFALADSSPQPCLEMLFHIDGDNVWTPIALSQMEDTSVPEWLSISNPADQAQLAMVADRWAIILDAQNWLVQAQKVPSSQAPFRITTSAWQPDGAMIGQWLHAIAETETVDYALAALCDACSQAGITLP